MDSHVMEKEKNEKFAYSNMRWLMEQESMGGQGSGKETEKKIPPSSISQLHCPPFFFFLLPPLFHYLLVLLSSFRT
jgi:hypothetical protein